MIRPRPPYCESCDRGIPANHITIDQRHDPAAGGCGGPVRPLADREGLPEGAAAIGIYARIGDRWILQWPPYQTVKSAQEVASKYAAGTVLELRPLYDGNPHDIPLLARIETLMDLNANLAEALDRNMENALRWDAWCIFTSAQDEPARLAMELVIGPILDAGKVPNKADLDRAIDAARNLKRSPA